MAPKKFLTKIRRKFVMSLEIRQELPLYSGVQMNDSDSHCTSARSAIIVFFCLQFEEAWYVC